VKKYLDEEFAKLGSKNTMELEDLHGGKPWVADPNHWNFEAAKRATKVCAFLIVFPHSTNFVII
jgi:Cys-Gly metallodipeptidase DUG1